MANVRARWWIFLGAALLCGASLVWAASSGPDPYPTHYGIDGAANAWQSRGAGVPMMAALAGFLALLFGGLSHFIPKLPATMVNTPHRDYWLAAEHRPEMNRITSMFFLQIGTLVLLLLASSTVITIVAQHSHHGGTVHAVVVAGFLLAILGTVGHLVWRLAHPPRDHPA